MTALDDAPITKDGKAGHCMNCRRGSHVMCTSPVCTCSDRFGHPRRTESRRNDPKEAAVPHTPEAPTPPQLIWEEPPARARDLIPAEVLAALRANPGRWARVKEYKVASGASTAAGKVRKGAIGDGFEARGSRTDKGSVLHLRFLGPPK